MTTTTERDATQNDLLLPDWPIARVAMIKYNFERKLILLLDTYTVTELELN